MATAPRAAAAVLNATNTIASRAVHITISPLPNTLHERRSILRTLKEFGEVVMFKASNDGPDVPARHFIQALYREEKSAERLIAESPLRLAIAPPPKPRPNSSLQTLEFLQPEASSSIMKAPTNSEPSEREFYLTADWSRANYMDDMRRQKYYWAYIANSHAFTKEDLAQTVPVPAYSDIELDPTPVPERVWRENVQAVAEQKSLRQLWFMGQQQRAQGTLDNEEPH